MLPPINGNPIEKRADPSLPGDLVVEQESHKLPILRKSVDLDGKISTGRFNFCLPPQDEQPPDVLSTLQNIQILFLGYWFTR